MRGIFLVFTLAALLSGCIQASGSDADGSAGDGSTTSQTCINGQCSTCVDGVCTGPLEEFRQEAAQQHADVDIQEDYDLTQGLAETSWSFWVDANATGHAVLRAVDMATEQYSVVPSVCISWERRTPSSSTSGTTGNCSGNGLSISISGGGLSDGTILSWQSLEPGRYTLTASAPPQPNRLFVDVVVDNP